MTPITLTTFLARLTVGTLLAASPLLAIAYPEPNHGFLFNWVGWLLIFFVYLPLFVTFVVVGAVAAAVAHPFGLVVVGLFGFGYWRFVRTLRGDRERPMDLPAAETAPERAAPRLITYRPRD